MDLKDMIKEGMEEKELSSVLEALITLDNRAYPNFGNVVIMAGGAGCYPSGTQFFNGSGWKNIEDYKEGDMVLQYNLDGTTEMVKPEGFVNLPTDQFTRIKNRRVDFITSNDHRHLLINDKTKNLEVKRTHEIVEKHNRLKRGNKSKFLTSFYYDGRGLDLTDDNIRLMVAIYADGHFMKRVNNPKCRFSFKKQRKIDRIKLLLKSNSITYRTYMDNGFTRFEFNYDSDEKEFNDYWYNASNDQLKVVCDEVLKWDGCVIKSDNRLDKRSFTSTSKKSIDFIQFAFTSIGNDVNIQVDKRVYGSSDGNCYSIIINNSNGVGISKDLRGDRKCTTTMEHVDAGDRMYCFTVPSGFFVVRQGGKIYVSGNSGKGFIQSNLLGMEGKTFDVDALKQMALKSTKIANKVRNDFDIELKDLNLKDPSDVGLLHDIIGSTMNLPNKHKQALYSSILVSDPERKPNIIFDVTLKDVKKLDSITRDVTRLGYKNDKIHIVWVINDIDVAIEQNQKRSMVVPKDILLDTHRGVALTMSDIVKGSLDVKNYMDGDIWFVFNKRGVDSTLERSLIDKSLFSIKNAKMVKIKKARKPIQKSKITKALVNKILSYVPKIEKLFK